MVSNPYSDLPVNEFGTLDRTIDMGALAAGLAAAPAAAVLLLGWTSLGLPLAGSGAGEDDEAVVCAALLLGSAISSFLLAALAAAGWVRAAAALGLALPCAAAALGGRRAWRGLRSMAGALPGAGAAWAPCLWALAAFALLAWCVASCPPRDADVMRYHLAHVRQIVQDGAWLPIADVCYAFPFGWSLSYLPFELLGLPEGAAMLNLGLWLACLGLLAAWVRREGLADGAFGLVALLMLHPTVLRMAATAHADMRFILEAAVTAALLARPDAGTPRRWACLGFAACVGLQSRYQGAALALAAAAAALPSLTRGEGRRGRILGFAAGAATAGALSLPFYAMNLRGFGDPFWPLYTGLFGHGGYADRMAGLFVLELNGRHEPGVYAAALKGLLTEVYVFPLPLLAAGLLGSALVSRRLREARGSLLVLIGVYLAVWASSQPVLFSRFILPLAPALVMTLAWLCGVLVPEGLRRGWRLALAAAAAVFLAADGAYSLDAMRYLARGDGAAYHRFTNFYPVFEWADAHSPPDSRFLVVLLSGQSYYLARPHRRADPWLSGVVDWTSVGSAEDLLGVLRRGGFTRVIYEPGVWSTHPGADAMEAAFSQAEARGLLRVETKMEVEVATQRLTRQSKRANIVVYSVPE